MVLGREHVESVIALSCFCLQISCLSSWQNFYRRKRLRLARSQRRPSSVLSKCSCSKEDQENGSCECSILSVIASSIIFKMVALPSDTSILLEVESANVVMGKRLFAVKPTNCKWRLRQIEPGKVFLWLLNLVRPCRKYSISAQRHLKDPSIVAVSASTTCLERFSQWNRVSICEWKLRLTETVRAIKRTRLFLIITTLVVTRLYKMETWPLSRRFTQKSCLFAPFSHQRWKEIVTDWSRNLSVYMFHQCKVSADCTSGWSIDPGRWADKTRKERVFHPIFESFTRRGWRYQRIAAVKV